MVQFQGKSWLENGQNMSLGFLVNEDLKMIGSTQPHLVQEMLVNPVKDAFRTSHSGNFVLQMNHMIDLVQLNRTYNATQRVQRKLLPKR